MLLDDLVAVIKKIQQRIRDHSATLRQNEIRTRTALIDPLLTALGWDVSDPALVTPEYSAGNGRADYALLGGTMNPEAFIEAKRFGEPLERPQHEAQVFGYALRQQVKFALLTDGNRWVFDDVSVFDGGERRKLDITIADTPAHESALKLLLLWRPNLASGRPVAANEPVLKDLAEDPSATADTLDTDDAAMIQAEVTPSTVAARAHETANAAAPDLSDSATVQSDANPSAWHNSDADEPEVAKEPSSNAADPISPFIPSKRSGEWIRLTQMAIISLTHPTNPAII